MTLAAWFSLLAICLLGAMTPGPSLAVVIRHSVSHGRGQGVITAVSHALGVGIYAVATALGLAAVIATDPRLFAGLTLAGSAYLLWLGATALRGAGQTPAGQPTPRRGTAARDGFAIAFLNPKIAVFFLALFSQFIPAEASPGDVALLALTATVVDAGWYALVAVALTHGGAAVWLRRHGIWIERLTSAALVFLALTTAASLLPVQ